MSKKLFGCEVVGWAWPYSERSRTSHLVLAWRDKAGVKIGKSACGKPSGGQVQATVPPGLSACRTCAGHHEAHLGPVEVGP